MSKTSTFIKDIENYFLNLSEKGVMLSSRDYMLIGEWLERGFTKEQVCSGIRDAFEQKGKQGIRNIYDCIDFVTQSTGSAPGEEHSVSKSVLNNEQYLFRIIHNFNKLIDKEKHPNLLKLHNIYKEKLLIIDSSESNIFGEINKIEEQYFDQFLNCLEEKENSDLKNKIESIVNATNDYINERTRKKALNIEIKNHIIKEYILSNPFKTDQ